MITEIKHWIDNKFEGGKERFTIRRPADGEDFVHAHIADKALVARAVSSARRAYPAWRDLTLKQRCEFVEKMADWLADHYGDEGEATELKSTIMEEVGKPLPEADIEVIETSDFLRFFANNAVEALSATEPKLDQELWPTKRSIVERVPLGVVAIIKPWNYPLEMIGWSLGGALVAGNTCVIKPSEKSPKTASFFARMCSDIGLPPGVISIVYGDAATGQALASHPDVNMVSFTGSYRAGKYVAKACADRLAKASLELSGNDAAIVLADADLDLTARGLVWGAFCNAGQVCVGVKRALVVESVYDELLKRVIALTASLREEVDYGPIISKDQLNSVIAFVEDALQKGAKAELGAEVGSKGNFYSPTVLTNVSPNSKLLADECFGPILPLVKVEGVAEAVRLANDSDYGLGASIWTSDNSKGLEIAKKLEVGMVWINDVNVAFPQTPWSGTKASGIGFELSAAALQEYSRLKHVNIETGSDKDRDWWYPYGS